jgi:HEAT repeat protein
LRGGENTLPALQLALTDEDAEVRISAAKALGTCEDKRSIQALASALSDEDIWVRAAAVRSLGRLPGESADELIKLALGDPVELVTIAALETLTERDPLAARSEFLQALGHRDEEIVKAALRGLNMVEDRTWLPSQIDSLLDHPHWDVRLAFLSFLRAEEASACRERLEQRLLVEADDTVRRKLGEFLAGIEKGGKQV